MEIKLFYKILLSIVIFYYSNLNGQNQKPVDPKSFIKEQLSRPFGTILKLKVKVIDGQILRMKEYQSTFLLLIKEIEGKPLTDSLIMEFVDETGTLARNDFDLYKLLYGKETGRLNSDTIEIMKKHYVGHTYDIVAYETGAFYGDPVGYSKYQMSRQLPSFQFRNYLSVISNETTKK